MNEGMNELMMVSFDQYLFWCALALRKCSPPAFLFGFSSPPTGVHFTLSPAFATFQGHMDGVTIKYLDGFSTKGSSRALTFQVVPKGSHPHLPKMPVCLAPSLRAAHEKEWIVF